jgi:PIN domain nuclease of toxin-antitoxin system
MQRGAFPARTLSGRYVMPGNQPVVYWDTCVWLSWLTGEKRDPDCLDGMEEATELLEAKKLTISTSAITITEILEAKIGKVTRDNFLAQFQRENCALIDVNEPIAVLASDLRSYYQRQLAKEDCQH